MQCTGLVLAQTKTSGLGLGPVGLQWLHAPGQSICETLPAAHKRHTQVGCFKKLSGLTFIRIAHVDNFLEQSDITRSERHSLR